MLRELWRWHSDADESRAGTRDIRGLGVSHVDQHADLWGESMPGGLFVRSMVDVVAMHERADDANAPHNDTSGVRWIAMPASFDARQEFELPGGLRPLRLDIVVRMLLERRSNAYTNRKSTARERRTVFRRAIAE